LRCALHIFPSFSTPEGERHKKKSQPAHILREHAHVPALAERTHKARISFLRFDLHATHACTLQPAALVFVSHGFVLVRVRVRVRGVTTTPCLVNCLFPAGSKHYVRECKSSSSRAMGSYRNMSSPITNFSGTYSKLPLLEEWGLATCLASGNISVK
jgi:hypothetical protein